jgi:CRISPR-associated protein Cmr1
MRTAKAKTYTLQALTDIWTGDADGKPDRLITTGLLGSIRWWFEVLVRGLEGRACDPTSPVRCPDSHINDPKQPGHRCVVCELFGCTGWARKFRFEVLDQNGATKSSRIEKDNKFKLRFTELRPMKPEEWALLDLTLRLIADYGAIGGKTVYKPSDEQNRQSARHHRDYGLIEYVSEPPDWSSKKTRDELTTYVLAPQWRRCPHQYRDDQNRIRDFSWASLANFWCVKGRYLGRRDPRRSSFNEVLGRKSDKSVKQRKGKRLVRWSDLLDNPKDKTAMWLAGSKQESKKVFSFKEPVRTFGFVKPDIIDFDGILQRLRSAWPRLTDDELVKGSEILERLFSSSLAGGR